MSQVLPKRDKIGSSDSPISRTASKSSTVIAYLQPRSCPTVGPSRLTTETPSIKTGYLKSRLKRSLTVRISSSQISWLASPKPELGRWTDFLPTISRPKTVSSSSKAFVGPSTSTPKPRQTSGSRRWRVTICKLPIKRTQTI